MKLNLHKSLLRRFADRRPSRPSDTPAADAVFTTAELLELILLYVDERTLLVSASRVCVAWREAIAASFRLQEALFFRAPALPDPKLDPSSCPAARRRNPLLQEAFGPLFREGLEQPGDKRSRYWMFGMDGMLEMRLPIADVDSRRKRHKAFIRRGASWRRMLVCQAPLRRVGYIRAAQSRGVYQSFSDQILDFPDGLRMGQLYDMIYSIVWGDGSVDRGQHHAWLCWDLARPKNCLTGDRWLETIRGLVNEWADDVDIIIGEDHTPYAPSCNFHNPLLSSPEKPQDAAWMFRCREFKNTDLDLPALDLSSSA